MFRRVREKRRAVAPCDPVPGRDGASEQDERSRWFRDHFEESPGEIVDFLGGDGIDLGGLEVADVGNGDGIIDLGLCLRAGPRRLVGYDIRPTDAAELLERAREEGVADELPDALEFAAAEPTRIPAPDASFDVVLSWSAFEHIIDPVPVLNEIRRILRPGGTFMLQLWPFYFSEHGSHLWHWFPEGFANLRHDDATIESTMRADTETDPNWVEMKLTDNRELNRITLDELQRALLVAGLVPVKVELITHAIHLSPELNRHPLSNLTISGVKLLASPG